MGEINKALARVLNKVPAILKDRKTEGGQRYAFRGIDDLYNAIHPLHKEEGIVIFPSVLDREREERESTRGGTLIYTLVTMKFKFVAKDGSYEEATTIGEAMDSGDKSSNKAQSVALKYCLMQMYLIPTEAMREEEPDANTTGARPKKQLPDKDKELIEILVGTCETRDELVKAVKEYPQYSGYPDFMLIFKKRKDELIASGDWFNNTKPKATAPKKQSTNVKKGGQNELNL